MTIIIPWPYLWFSKNQSGTFFSVYGRRATASSHISYDLKWSGIILNDHGWLHMHCNITHLLRQETIRDRLQYPWIFFNGFSTHLLSFKDKRSNTSSEVIKIMPVSMGTASSHISWILKWSRTNLKFDRLWATASLHTFLVFSSDQEHISMTMDSCPLPCCTSLGSWSDQGQISGSMGCGPLPRCIFFGRLEYIAASCATRHTIVHSAVFTGHLVYACVVVALIFCNNNSLIMMRELTSIT